MTAVDRLRSHSADAPTFGQLPVRESNRAHVEYALAGQSKPITVAEWDTCLNRALPAELQNNRLTIEQIEAELQLNSCKRPSR